MVTEFGRTSLTMHAEVRVESTRRTILTVGSMVFVTVDEQGVRVPHGRTGARRADSARVICQTRQRRGRRTSASP